MNFIWERIFHCPYFGMFLLRLCISLTFCNWSTTVLGWWWGVSWLSIQFSLKHLKPYHVSSPLFPILNGITFHFLFISYIFYTLNSTFSVSLNSSQLVPTLLEVYAKKRHKDSNTGLANTAWSRRITSYFWTHFCFPTLGRGLPVSPTAEHRWVTSSLWLAMGD